MRTLIVACAFAVSSWANSLFAAGEAASTVKDATARLAFVASGPEEFSFNTGLLKGKLRAEGKSTGLSSVVHLPTGILLDTSMGLFSYYRVFSTGKRYGVGAWDWPSKAALKPDGSVEVIWPAAAGRPFEMRAQYRWAGPETLDLQTVVEASAALPGFEVFLASYFTPGFTNSMVFAPAPAPNGLFFLFAPADEAAGMWQTFPRDDSAVALIKDGRWKLEPHPVDWVIRSRLSGALGVRQAPAAGVTALLMSRKQDCFAIFTPHSRESHYSTYLSLFGADLKPGEKAVARTRLVLTRQSTEDEWLKELRAFVEASRD